MDYRQRITIVCQTSTEREERVMAELRQLIMDKLQNGADDAAIRCYWEQQLDETAERYGQKTEEDRIGVDITGQKLPLSERQREIVELLCAHHSVKKIAGLLHISENTVKKHVQNIKRELAIKESGLDFVYELLSKLKGGN
ncbi:response regulator transcription factor [Paenibacillus sedimenti]|uniref:HTH luxR-type domain-containing protein n=1 Tax=Paenibacillus sedimenti TaxID=2770274 RepID=A0A926KX27_9BACL|nr:helix-turn-helix transcriptional regulator [Paenibacillus sedimenti]MBD0383540.1 hypothetical protein [Paenibacillus sedimenti]